KIQETQKTQNAFVFVCVCCVRTETCNFVEWAIHRKFDPKLTHLTNEGISRQPFVFGDPLCSPKMRSKRRKTTKRENSTNKQKKKKKRNQTDKQTPKERRERKNSTTKK